MPNYLVELEDGRKFQVEADSPPTSDDLTQYFAAQSAPQAQAAKKDLPFGDITDVASALGQAASSSLTTVPASFRQMYEGSMNPWEKSAESLESRKAMQRVAQESEAAQAEAEASGDASVMGRAIRSGIPSYGFTGAILPVSVAAGGVAGLGTGLVSKNPVAAQRAAMAAGSAASGVASYRMAASQFMDDARERIDNFFLEKAGRLPNKQEQDEAYQELLPLAQEMGMSEALPEAFGNLALAGAGKYIYRILGGKTGVQQLASGALSKARGLNAAKALGAGAASTGVEVGTEGLTEMLNEDTMKKLEEGVMRGEDVSTVQTEPYSMKRLGESIEKVAEPTLATTAIMGLLGAGGGMAYRAATKQNLTESDFRNKMEKQLQASQIGLADPEATAANKSIYGEKAEEAAAALKALDEGRTSDVEKFFNVRFKPSETIAEEPSMLAPEIVIAAENLKATENVPFTDVSGQATAPIIEQNNQIASQPAIQPKQAVEEAGAEVVVSARQESDADLAARIDNYRRFLAANPGYVGVEQDLQAALAEQQRRQTTPTANQANFEARNQNMLPDTDDFGGKFEKPLRIDPNSYTNSNGIETVNYINPNNGLVDVYISAFGNNDFIAYMRHYDENGAPTNRWTSKLERRTTKAGATKAMLRELQSRLPKDHQYTEDVSVSTDGLRFFTNQLQQGYEVARNPDGTPQTTEVAISGESITNDLPISVDPNGKFENIRVSNPKEFAKVQEHLAKMLEKFGVGLNKSNVRWENGTVFIDLPVLNKKSQTDKVVEKDQVTTETPSLPETGPPVVDQEAPAGTPVQAAPIQPENLQSALDAHTSGPKTPEQDWQFAVSMPEGVWIEDGLGGRMRKKIHRIKSSGSEEIEFEHQVFNEETGKWEDNPSAYAFMSKKKDGSLAVNNRFPSPLQPASYTEISTGERKISKPIVVLSSPQPVETQEDAAPEIPLEESLRQEPQDRIESREAEETGAGDQLLRPAEGEVEEEVRRKLRQPYASIAIPDLEKIPSRDWMGRRDYLEGKLRNNQQERAELLKTSKQNWESREYNENARINEVAASLRAAIQDMQLARPDLEAEFKAKSRTQTESRGDAEVDRRSESETRTPAADVGGANGELRRESETLQRVSEQPPASANLGDKATGSGTVQPNSSRLTSNVEKFASKIRAQFKADELTEKEEDLKEKYYSINASAGKSASEAKDKAYSAWKRTEAAAKKARADAFAELRRQNKGFTLAQIADKEPFILARTLEKHGIVNEAIQAGYIKSGESYIFQPAITPPGEPTTATEGMVTPGGVATERDLSKPEQMTPEESRGRSYEEWIITESRKGGGPMATGHTQFQIKVAGKQGADDYIQKLTSRNNNLTASARPSGKTVPITSEIHRNLVEDATMDKKPVSTAAVDTYGITLPEGYVKQGDLYVFTQPESPIQTGSRTGTTRPEKGEERGEKNALETQGRSVSGLGEYFSDDVVMSALDLVNKPESSKVMNPSFVNEARPLADMLGKHPDEVNAIMGFPFSSRPNLVKIVLGLPIDAGSISLDQIRSYSEMFGEFKNAKNYSKQGDLYVFQPQTTAAETQTPESVGRGLGGSRGASSSLEGGRSSELPEVSLETESESSGNLSTAEAAMSYLMDDLTDAQKAKWTPEMFAAAKTYFDGGGKDFESLQKVVKFPRVVSQAYLKADKAASEEQARIDKAQRATDAEIAKAEREEKKLEAEMLKREEMRSKAIDSIIGAAEKKKRKFGQVTNSDAIAAVAMLVSSKDVPGVLTTWTGTKEDFLRDPANRMADPEIYARIKAGELVEGFFNKGRAYVFLDGIGVSEADMLRGEQMSVTPQVAAVRRVLLHESLVHRGIHGLPLRHRRLILNWVRQNSTPQELDELASLYTEYANWRNSDYEFEALAEELLAKKVDSLTEIPKDGPMAKLMDILRQIWDFIVGYKREPTLSDLKSVIKLLKSGAEALANDRLKDGGEVKLSMIAPAAGITPEMDAEYMAAVEAGDMEKAQRMVDEAARATIPPIDRISIFDVRGKPVEVIKNATRRERKSLESDGMVGEILLPTGDTLSFNRMNALHGEVLNRLGIRKAAVVTGLLYPDGFLVTDRTSSELSENPSTPARIRAKYRVDEIGFYNDAIVGPWEELPESPTPIDPVTYDDNGNVIPLSQRFQPTSPDIRFSRPQFHSDTSAAFTAGSEAARSTLYSERDMDIREAIRRAYEAMPKTNSVAVPIGELFAKTEELMPGVTQDEFSLVLQDLFEDNGAVLQEGDVVEPLTEQDRRYLALAQDEDANREELQRMVDEAAGVPKVFDAQSGIGQVPFNRAVSSRGFRKAMTQKEFRSLVPSGVSGPSTKNYVEDAIRSGKKIGQPFLMVKWDDKNKRWVVTDHEGRSRIDAFDKVFQGKRAEVHIFPSGLMAKDLTPEMKNAPFQKQGVLALGEDYIKKFGVYDFGKSLDAITRDDQGRIIPLSRRFDTGADIRGQINVTTPEGKRAGFVVVMPSKSISVPIALRSMATSEPSKQPINQQKYDEALAAISDFLSGKQTIQFPGKLALSSNTGAGFIADDSRITQGLGEAARTTGGETGTGTAGGQPSDAQVQGVAQQGFGPYSVRNLVGEASRIGVADVRIDPESKHGAYTTVSESGEIYIGINPARMANRIAANDGDVQYAIGSILNEELIHAADMAVLKEQWLSSGSKLTLTEFVKEQDVKTVREMIQVAKSSNDPVASTRILFDAITSSVNLYAGNDVTSLDSVETFLNAASHDEISSVMGEFVRQMIQTGLYQTVSEKTLFRKFIEKVVSLARKIADVFAPAKEGRYGKLIKERLNGIEELLAYASTKTGAKASRIRTEDATEAAKTFQADIIEAGKGRIDTDSYQGNTLKSTEAPDHNVNAPELYKDAAISLVDSLLKKHSITDIADSFQDPEFRVAVGLLGNKAINPNVAQQAELFTGAEIQNRLEKAFRDESDPAKKRLIEKTLKNHKAYYTVATGIGQNLNAVGALQQDPRFKWMFLFNEAEKEMADKGKEKLDAITGGTQPVTDTVNQSEEAAADEATKQIEESVEEDEYANLLNEGEEGLEGRRKTIWERAKMILRRLAMYARADKMDVKTGSKASLSAEQRKELDELNAILRMPKAERDKAREKDLAEFDDLMAEFLGLESDAKTPERKNTRAKRKKMVDTAKKRAEAGKSIDISDTESAVKIVLREMGKARPGKQVPLTKLMPWKDILAQKAKTVEEYRQRILDAMMASDAFKEVSDDDKANIADIFAKQWDKKRKDILDRMLEREIERKRKEGSLSEAAAKALQKSRNKIIELANLGGFDNDDLMKVLGEKFGIKTGFSEAEKARISELADKLQDETLNPAKRNKLAMEFAIELAGAMDVSIIEIIANWWTSSVLFGPQTIFSIGAAFLNGGYSIATIGIRRSLARLTKGDVQGALEESILMLKGFSRYLGAFKQAGRRAWGYLWTGDVGLLGIGSNDILSEISNFEQLQKFQRHKLLAEQLAKDPKRVRRYVGIYLRFVSRLLTALDAFNVMVTKATTASLALRMSGMSTENIIKAEKMLNLKAYKDQVIRDYFDNKAPRTPYEKGLVDSYAEAEMYRAIDKMGGKMENADYLASESAMTMNPTGLGGFFYRSITGLDSKMKKAAEDYLEKTKKEWTTEKDLESALFLGLAYLRQFAVQNLGGVAGYKFIRFASNKFNQGISYLPMVGLLRTLEAKGDDIKGKEAFIETIHRNQVIGAVLTLAAIAVVKAIEEEPDDDERGNFWNGGWQNLTPDQKKQMLAKGQEEYTMGFKFNGRWYVFKYQNWPMNQVLAAIGSMSDQIRFSPKQWEEKGPLSKSLAGIVSGLKSTLEIPALSQLGTLVGNRLASKDPTEQTVDRLSNVAAGWVGGFVPRILKDLDFATQPELRKYKTLWEKTASHIPIYRRYVGEDYYDILGQPIKRNVIPGSREFMMGPTEPEYKILGALNSRNIFLTPANAEYRMVGKGRNRRRLTQEEADAYSLETGKGYRQMLLRYGQRALQMPTERARAFLSDKADEVRDRALKKVYRGYK